MKRITNHDDYLDSRDIQERINELMQSAADKGLNDNEDYERVVLENLKQQYVDSFGEDSWEFGATFIRESYFKEHAQEFAVDSGAIKDNMNWPYNCIDWERAADELSQDYTDFYFDNINYLAGEA
jgi:hypothetical protein